MELSTTKVGVFGGAFDPPHRGHLALALGGLAHFELERLIVRVVARPGHKRVTTPAAMRLALARLAFDDIPGVETSIEPHGRTVDQLRALGLADPVFLIGADELADFLSWKEPERVLELARLGVGTRPGTDSARFEAVCAQLERPERIEPFAIEAPRSRLLGAPPPGRRRRAARRARARRGRHCDRALRPLSRVLTSARRGYTENGRSKGRRPTDPNRARTPHRRSLHREAGHGRRHSRHAGGLRLHRLLRHRHRA